LELFCLDKPDGSWLKWTMKGKNRGGIRIWGGFATMMRGNRWTRIPQRIGDGWGRGRGGGGGVWKSLRKKIGLGSRREKRANG